MKKIILYTLFIVFAIATHGQSITIAFGHSSQNPHKGDKSEPKIENQQTKIITNKKEVNLSLTSKFLGSFFVMKVPVSQPEKFFWSNGFGMNPIPDVVFRKPFVVGQFRYYVSRDAAGLAFDYHNPIIFY